MEHIFSNLLHFPFRYHEDDGTDLQDYQSYQKLTKLVKTNAPFYWKQEKKDGSKYWTFEFALMLAAYELHRYTEHGSFDAHFFQETLADRIINLNQQDLYALCASSSFF